MGSFADAILKEAGIDILNYDPPTINSMAQERVESDYQGPIGEIRFLSDLNKLSKADKAFHRYLRARYKNKWFRLVPKTRNHENLKFDVAKRFVTLYRVERYRSLLNH